MKAARQSRTGPWVQVALAAIAVVAAVWWFRTHPFDWTGFGRSLAGLDYGWVAAACGVAILTYAGRAVRWRVFIEHARPCAPFWPILEATFIGFTFSVLLGRAGEFVRPWLIARSQRLTVSSQLAVWFLERLTDLIAVLILFGFVLTRFEISQANQAGPEVRWVLEYGGRALGAMGGISLLILLVFRAFSEEAAGRVMAGLAILPEAWRERLAPLVTAFASGVESTRNASVLMRIGLYTIVEWGLIALSFYWLLRSSPATRHLNLEDSLIVLGFLSFASIIQIPGVGGGAQIVTILVLTQLFDVAVEPAAAMALLMWVVGFALVTPIGLALTARAGFGWRQMIATAQDSAGDPGTPSAAANPGELEGPPAARESNGPGLRP